MSEQLSETSVNDALDNLSWSSLSEHLATTALTQAEVDKLIEIIRHSDALILKRGNSSKEKKRTKLLNSIAEYLEAKCYSGEASSIRDYQKRIDEIDEAYKGILDLLSKTDAAALSPELRVSALLERSNLEYIELRNLALKAMKEQGVLDLGAVKIKTEDGQEVNLAAVHDLLIATFASTLGMEAHINGWYEADGVLTLPSLPVSTEENRFAVGSLQALAASWRNWQFAERRHRFLNGTLEKDTELHPSWAESGVTSLWKSLPSDDGREFYNFVANNRLSDRLSQHWVSVITNATYRNAVAGISSRAKLLPHNAISLQEIHGATALSQLLSGEITEDQSEYAGLTFAEWVRGYSVLQTVCEAAWETGDASKLTIRLTQAELVSLLERLGLCNGKAETFIGHATYKKMSRDLFDQPLIKMRDGDYVMLALAGATSSIPQVVLSTLGMLGVSLDARGKRFEKSVIRFLSRQGIQAKNILCKRDGETYDYDVAFVWGDYLFLLECKSRGLPSGDPTRAYYFSLGIRDVVKQVKRLAEGLQRNPDILTEHFPEAVGKEIVYCVINSLPFSMFGDVDGIYFTDEGSLNRFFQESAIGPRSVGIAKGIGDIDPNTAIAFLWDGASPTPEDLLRHLRSPIQLVMVGAHTELLPTYLPIGEQTAQCLMEFGRKNATSASYRKAAQEAGYKTGADLTE